MKKLGFILLLVSLFLVGCTSPSKENSVHLRPQTKVQSDKPVQLKNQVLRNQLLLKRIHLQQAVKSQSPILLLHLVVQLRQIFLLQQ